MRGYQRGIWRREIKAGRAVTGAGTGSPRAPVPRMRCNATPFASWCSAKPGPARWVPALRRTAVEALRRVRDTNVGRSHPRKFPIPRRNAPELCVNLVPPKTEGAGKAGCALHPRSRVQYVHKNTHTSIQVQRRHPAFPAQWFTAYFALSPVNGLSCHRRHADTSAQLDASIAASGPRDFAVRERLRSSCASPASTASHRAFRDVRNAPLIG